MRTLFVPVPSRNFEDVVQYRKTFEDKVTDSREMVRYTLQVYKRCASEMALIGRDIKALLDKAENFLEEMDNVRATAENVRKDELISNMEKCNDMVYYENVAVRKRKRERRELVSELNDAINYFIEYLGIEAEGMEEKDLRKYYSAVVSNILAQRQHAGAGTARFLDTLADEVVVSVAAGDLRSALRKEIAALQYLRS